MVLAQAGRRHGFGLVGRALPWGPELALGPHPVCVSHVAVPQLGGCGVLGVGIWLAATQGSFATLSSSFPSLSAANLLIITGAFVMAIGFVGCLGAIKENKCLLLTVSAGAQAMLRVGPRRVGLRWSPGLGCCSDPPDVGTTSGA